MRQNTQPEKQSLTPMQKQAVLVCIVCALAALLTIGITLVLIHRGKEPAASSEQPGTEQPADDANIADHYQINEQSSALLPETADAGDAYPVSYTHLTLPTKRIVSISVVDVYFKKKKKKQKFGNNADYNR